MTAWTSAEWLKLTIPNALHYLDELRVCIAPHAPRFADLQDDSQEVAKSFEGDTVLIHNTEWPTDTNTIPDVTKCRILNELIGMKDVNDGDVLVIVDADECYDEEGQALLKAFAEQDECPVGLVKGMYFCINLHWYFINPEMMRLFRYEKGFKYIPTQKPVFPSVGSNPCYTHTGATMYHYSMLQDAELRKRYWEISPPHDKVTQRRKRIWLDMVYSRWDVTDQRASAMRNKQQTGRRGFWHTDDMEEDGEGLFRFTGRHPTEVANSRFMLVEDFRR
jgi:hypothetical protein